MSKLTCLENYIDKDQNHYGSFLIEPLEVGQGITLGNTLRRTILSDLTGYAITGVRINDIKHEFAVIEGVREDVLDILLNLKEIIFKNSSLSKDVEFRGFLNVKGPTIVTAGMFYLPKNTLSILNPSQYICTIVDNSEFFIDIDIENGKGYELTEENQKQKLQRQIGSEYPSTLFIDGLFMPIRKVNYKIKLIHDSKGNIKESLNLEITTNGSISPKRSLHEALKLILELFYSLFLNENFFAVSENINKKNESPNKKNESLNKN